MLIPNFIKSDLKSDKGNVILLLLNKCIITECIYIKFHVYQKREIYLKAFIQIFLTWANSLIKSLITCPSMTMFYDAIRQS